MSRLRTWWRLRRQGRRIVKWDPVGLDPAECPGCLLDKPRLCAYHQTHGWTPRNREERRRAQRQARR